MKLLPDCLSRIVNCNCVEREIEEELLFHLNMRTQEYIERGMSEPHAQKLAAQRFGNLQHIKVECAQIANRNRLFVRVTKSFLVLMLFAGILIHIVSVERDVRHIGDILVAISILMRMLLYVRSLSRFRVSAAGRE